MASFLKPLVRSSKNNKFHYEPRYSKEKTLEDRKNNIKLERGSFYKHSKTLSKFKEPSISHYKHNTKARKNAKYIITLAMMACVYVFYNYGGSAGYFALAGLLISLVAFISLNNRS